MHVHVKNVKVLLLNVSFYSYFSDASDLRGSYAV